MATLNRAIGVKGSDVYSTTGDARVDLSVMLVRGCSGEIIWNGLDKILDMAKQDLQAFEDAFVLAFQTRNIRGGKGERSLALTMFQYLANKYPDLFNNHLLDLIPRYGSWRDVFALAAASTSSSPFTQKALIKMAADQIRKDEQTAPDQSISLVGKWAPAEKSEFGPIARELAYVLFPASASYSSRMKQYRQLTSKLNARVKTTEIKMCANTWADIVPKEVPGRCLHKHRKAFLNVRSTNEVRYADRPDREICREHFEEFFAAAKRGDVKVNGADTMFPHEVIAYILRGNLLPQDQDLCRAQWKAFVEKAKEGGQLSRCLAMCDFSGSMDGLPKLICTALGLLIAEVSGVNKIMTFDSTPQWHVFPEADIFERLQSIGPHLGQGLSTNFQAAMDLLLKDAVQRKLTPEQMPKDLIVFTDMGWDQATGQHSRYNTTREGWETHLEMIRRNYRALGYEPPRIVVWNLRATYEDFHSEAEQEGVVMLSGWSPALFKILQEKGVQITTPLDALRAQLDDPMYDEIRHRIRAWQLGNK